MAGRGLKATGLGGQLLAPDCYVHGNQLSRTQGVATELV